MTSQQPPRDPPDSTGLERDPPRSAGLRGHLVALLPSRWWWLATLLWWTLRGVALVGRDAFAAVPLSLPKLAYGLAVDALLVGVAFASVRLIATWAPRRRGARVTAAALAGLWLGWLLIVRATDIAHCWVVNAHLTRGFWLHVGPGAWGVLTEPALLGGAAVVVALAVLVSVALQREGSLAAHAHTRRGEVHTRRTALATALLAATMWAGLMAAFALSWRQAPHPQHWALIPEINAAQTYWQFSHRVGAAAPLRTPDAAALARLRAAGLIPRRTLDARYPLMRARLSGFAQNARETKGAAALPRAASTTTTTGGGAAAADRPNVLLVLVESLSAGLVGHHTPRWRGLTPQLDRRAKRMSVATNYFNSTSPTINGWLATLCSVVPSAWSLDVDAGESVDGGGADFTCLSDLLVRRGYRAEHVQGASRTYTATEAILRGHGYHHVVGREDLRRLYPDSPENKWGKYDDVTVGHAIERLERLTADEAPWLLSVATIDLHTPGYPRPGCSPPARFTDDPVLTSAWCTDAALAELWKALDRLDLWRNTVVVISADHPIFPFPAVQELFHDKARQYGVFAQLPLLIHDPRGALPKRLPRLMSQLDVAPTVADVLGIPDEPNSFQGRSALAPPDVAPLAIGRMGSHTVHIRDGRRGVTLAFGVLLDRCEAGKPALARVAGAGPGVRPPAGQALPGQAATSALLACDLVKLFRWQDDLWARHELMPRRRRDVKERLRLDRLRQRWLQDDLSERRGKAAAPTSKR